MIRLGLTSFSEHGTLSEKKKTSLYEYAAHLPLVEIDTAYYGIPKQETVKQWVESVPTDFRFIIKAYSGISKQSDWQTYYQTEEQMIARFLNSMQPLIERKNLFAFLLQFSGSFSCTQENVAYLKKISSYFTGYPVAIELRNSSWYEKKHVKKMLKFMTDHHFSLVIVDEPQIPTNPVPFYPVLTNDSFVLFRFHGRNSLGWMANDKEWRKKRTLYRYNAQELKELATAVKNTSEKVKEVGVIFNNNSGGDAAGNLLEMKKILTIEYEQLNPKQLNLF